MITSMLAVAVACGCGRVGGTPVAYLGNFVKFSDKVISRKDTTITRIMISYTGLSTFDHILAKLRC